MPHDRFYGLAAEEVARHEVDKDLFARAYAAALGDPEKTKAIYIGIRAERLEELARELVATSERENKERQRREQEQARALVAAREKEDKERQMREREVLESRSVMAQPATKVTPMVTAPEHSLPKSEDFSDPQLDAAIRRMLDALSVSGPHK
ncbi:MAG: hypothetical protein WC378_05155 [Opitutaceae bacterium]